MIIDDEKLDKAIDNYVTNMTREQLEDYVAQERIDYFYGGGVDQEEIDDFIKENEIVELLRFLISTGQTMVAYEIINDEE